jgi:hypothetical protein
MYHQYWSVRCLAESRKMPISDMDFYDNSYMTQRREFGKKRHVCEIIITVVKEKPSSGNSTNQMSVREGMKVIQNVWTHVHKLPGRE